MRQKIFETREKAQELLEEAINIWRQSPQSERLEGFEKDPAMSLLISALAYQSNEIDNDIALMKTEVIQEYLQMLTPYELGRAIPATALIAATLNKDVNEWDVNSDTHFVLSDAGIPFMPIFHTRVINTDIKSIRRLDGRRWEVQLDFPTPIKDLSRFTFAIKNKFFEDVKVTYKGKPLPLVKPWHYSKFPMSECFSMDTALYNGSPTFNASMTAMELFASQNIRLFCIKEHRAESIMPTEADSIKLVFEFTGITDEFTFDHKELVLNCIMLADAQMGVASLSGDNPIARVAGSVNTSDQISNQFLHLIRPSSDYLYSDARIEVRRMAGDRFNQGRLTRLLGTLINKYHSDYYAFQNHQELIDNNTLHNLHDILDQLIKICKEDQYRSVEGVYLLLHHRELIERKDISINVSYLTTHGASINNLLNENSTFTMPAAFDSQQCSLLSVPSPGIDEINDQLCEDSLLRYHIITNDRVVTPADIKAFCTNELISRYGFDINMINSITVSHRLKSQLTGCGYEIVAEVKLANNNFVKRSFMDKITHVEVLMQKMMEVRSTNIYPIRVHITIEE